METHEARGVDVSFLDPDSAKRLAVEQGRQAQDLLQHPLVKEAFEVVTKLCLEAIADSAPSESDKREQAYLMLQGAKNWRRFFEICVAKGREVAAQLAFVANERAEKEREEEVLMEDPRL